MLKVTRDEVEYSETSRKIPHYYHLHIGRPRKMQRHGRRVSWFSYPGALKLTPRQARALGLPRLAPGGGPEEVELKRK